MAWWLTRSTMKSTNVSVTYFAASRNNQPWSNDESENRFNLHTTVSLISWSIWRRSFDTPSILKSPFFVIFTCRLHQQMEIPSALFSAFFTAKSHRLTKPLFGSVTIGDKTLVHRFPFGAAGLAGNPGSTLSPRGCAFSSSVFCKSQNSSSLNPSISRHCGVSWYFCQNIFCTFLSKLVPSCHFCAILKNLKKHFRYWFHFSLLHETPYLDVKLIHFFHPFHHLVPRSCCPVKHKGMGGRSKGSNFSWANNDQQRIYKSEKHGSSHQLRWMSGLNRVQRMPL